MKAFIGGVICAAVLVTGPASVSAQTTTTTRAVDNRITQRINADASLKRYDIKVSVAGDVATLTGAVATEADRAKAAELAMVTGISRVDNQLLVDLDAATKGTTGTVERKTKDAAEKTKDGAEKVIDKTKEGSEKAYEKTKAGTKKAAEKTKDGAEVAVDKTKEGLSKTGEAITDTWITTKIKSDMVNEDALHDSDVSVHTNNHVVTLSGTVMSAAGLARAVEIAKTTKGVNRVINKITIGPKK
jgi:osmotically-inducible protein OsmY